MKSARKPIQFHSTRQKFVEELRLIVANQLGLDLDQVEVDSAFQDNLGADSIDCLELVMAIEEHFEFDIDEDEVSDCNSINEICSYLTKYGYVQLAEECAEPESTENNNETKELAQIPKGRIFTVCLQCVDEKASAGLISALSGPKTTLIAGCSVLRIDPHDERMLRDALRDRIRASLDEED